MPDLAAATSAALADAEALRREIGEELEQRGHQLSKILHREKAMQDRLEF
jgi:hypothetical protein